MEKEYMPYIGGNFEKSDCKVLIIVDEVKDFADFKKSKYDNYCRYLIEENGAVQKILEQYDLKKDDVACYNYRYNCKAKIKLEKLKGKELTEYNNELKNCINKLEPYYIIIQREQITRNVAKRKKYFDSGKITFEKFLENKGIKRFECRKDGKQDPSLIKDQFLELKFSLNKINDFLKTLNPCQKYPVEYNKEKKCKKESFFIYNDQRENGRKSIISPKDLNEVYNLRQTNYSSEKEFRSDHRYDCNWEELNIKVCEELGIPFPNSEINHQLQCCVDYYKIKDCIKIALLIISELVSEDEKNKTSANTKNETISGKCLMVYAKDKKVALDNIVDKYKEIYKLNETDFYFFSYIDKSGLLYDLTEKNYQNLTEKPLSWYNEKLVEFIVENKPNTIVFLGGQLKITIFKNKIPSINKKIEEFLKENNISYFTEYRVTRENPSTKKDRLIQIKSLMENLQDDLNYLNPCNAAGELVLKNKKQIPESFLKEKTHDELCSKYHVPDSELERYCRYCNANGSLQKVIRKINEVILDDEKLEKFNRMVQLLGVAFVPLPMFFELLDSFKDESDFNRIEKIITDRSSMIAYNVEFWKKYKDNEEYEKKKMNSYNKRLNSFYTQLKEEHYVKEFLELIKERIFVEDQIKEIKIYRDLLCYQDFLSSHCECYRKEFYKAVRRGDFLEEKVRNGIKIRSWKPENP